MQMVSRIQTSDYGKRRKCKMCYEFLGRFDGTCYVSDISEITTLDKTLNIF